MKVINRLIDLPQEEEDKDSLFQEFRTFCTELFHHADKKMDREEVSSISIANNFPSLD